MLNRDDKRLRSYSVYVLRDPRDMRIRYVGMSCNPAKRFKQHTGCPYDLKRAWVLELRALGMRPHLQVLFSGLSVDSAELVERRLAYLHSEVYGILEGGTYRAKKLDGHKSVFVMSLCPARKTREQQKIAEQHRKVTKFWLLTGAAS